MKKYFTWQFINSPAGYRIIIGILITIFILWYIFRNVPNERRNQEKIIQLQSANEMLEQGKKDDSIFREIMISKIDVLQNSFNNKETSKQIIYERIRTDIHHYDTASINEITRFFTDRYGKE